LVAVTDGEASHPGREPELRRRRPAESARALDVLGVRPDRTVRLGLPDGAVRDSDVAAALHDLLGPEDLLLAPWEFDGHPDHDACGRAALEAVGRAGGDGRLIQYLVWAWHWATPPELPWRRARGIHLDPATRGRKRRAVTCFSTQLEGPRPVLPPHVLERLTRAVEVVLVP
jgi:LmbE family N-acetylglucosaminyl deacetylase